MKHNLKGIIPPIITPFNKSDEEIDEEALREQVSFLIEGGVHGIFSCGTSGEFFNLTSEERKKVNKIVVDAVNGKVPVFAGTGTSNTKETVVLTKHAQDIGADVAVVIAPYFTRATDKGIINHYETVANSVDIPIAIYNIPGRAGINVEPPLAKTIAQNKKIIAIKDSSGNMVQFEEMIYHVGGKIAVFQGEDQLILESLLLGADGSVPAVANVVPKLTVMLYEDYVKKRIEESKKKQMIINRLMRECFAFKPWPVGLKETLKIMGRDAGIVRSPLMPLDAESRSGLRDTVHKLQGEGIL